MSSEELRMPMPWGHIAAKAWGSPKDKRVLVVHGILDNAGSFDRLIRLLPQGYYFVCIDLPGHGLSSHFPAGISLDWFNYVLAIRRVVDYLKWENCIYLGHSLGGNLGTTFSSICPERVTKIICIDSFTSKPISEDQLIPSILRFHNNTLSIKDDGSKATNLYTKEEVLYRLMNLRGNALNVAAAEALMERSITKVGDKYKFNRDLRLNSSMFPFFNDEQHLVLIKRLKIPVSIILASTTTSTKRNDKAKNLLIEATANGNYDIVTVPGNHDVHNNHPERVAPHVCRFLSSITSSL